MDNHIFVLDTTEGIETISVENIVALEKLLNKGYEVKRGYTTNNALLLHVAEVEEEVEPMVESVVEIALDDNPETIKKWTDDGWMVKTYYSKRVQLVKMKDVEESK